MNFPEMISHQPEYFNTVIPCAFIKERLKYGVILLKFGVFAYVINFRNGFLRVLFFLGKICFQMFATPTNKTFIPSFLLENSVSLLAFLFITSVGFIVRIFLITRFSLKHWFFRSPIKK